jgi:hypothetical protein
LNAATLTTLVIAISAITSSGLLPVYLNRRKEHAQRVAGTEVSWEAINLALVKERDYLQKRFDELTTAHNAELIKLRDYHTNVINMLETKITNLKAELDRLYRTLYEQSTRQPPPSSPLPPHSS